MRVVCRLLQELINMAISRPERQTSFARNRRCLSIACALLSALATGYVLAFLAHGVPTRTDYQAEIRRTLTAVATTRNCTLAVHVEPAPATEAPQYKEGLWDEAYGTKHHIYAGRSSRTPFWSEMRLSGILTICCCVFPLPNCNMST
jgi:hypothetical protein